ncbi:MAG: hypothetical protein ACXVJE_19355 [Mucilaginibacter sp.]
MSKLKQKFKIVSVMAYQEYQTTKKNDDKLVDMLQFGVDAIGTRKIGLVRNSRCGQEHKGDILFSVKLKPKYITLKLGDEISLEVKF